MLSFQKFCKRCDTETDRYKDGRCKPCTQEKNNKWSKANREKVNARSRRWNEKNSDLKRDINARYREKNQSLINEKRRQKRIANPSEERVKAAKRRAPGNSLPKDIVAILLIKQGYKCACCEASLLDGYHLDHMMPISKGGLNTIDNVHLMAPKCNLQKYTMPFQEFMKKRRGKVVAS